MQVLELFPQHPSYCEKWLDDQPQMGRMLEQLDNAPFELQPGHGSDLEPEVPQQPAQIVLGVEDLRLHELAAVSSIRISWLRTVLTCTGL